MVWLLLIIGGLPAGAVVILMVGAALFTNTVNVLLVAALPEPSTMLATTTRACVDELTKVCVNTRDDGYRSVCTGVPSPQSSVAMCQSPVLEAESKAGSVIVEPSVM